MCQNRHDCLGGASVQGERRPRTKITMPATIRTSPNAIHRHELPSRVDPTPAVPEVTDVGVREAVRMERDGTGEACSDGLSVDAGVAEGRDMVTTGFGLPPGSVDMGVSVNADVAVVIGDAVGMGVSPSPVGVDVGMADSLAVPVAAAVVRLRVGEAEGEGEGPGVPEDTGGRVGLLEGGGCVGSGVTGVVGWLEGVGVGMVWL